MTSMRPAKIAGVIEVENSIKRLGIITDIHGKKWDIQGITKDCVQACPKDELHPYYTNTNSDQYTGLIEQEWKPYTVKIVTGKNK